MPKIPSFFQTLESPAVADYKLKQAEMMTQHMMRRRPSFCFSDGVQSSSASLGEKRLNGDTVGHSMQLISEGINKIQEEVDSDNESNPTCYLPLRDPLGNSMHCTNLLAGLEKVDTISKRPSVMRSLRSSVATMASVEETIEEDVLSSEEFGGNQERSSLASPSAPDTVSKVDRRRPASLGGMLRAKQWLCRSFHIFVYKL